MIRVETFESNSSRNSSGKKRRRKRKERRSRMIEECYVNEESAIDVSGEAREVSSQVGRNVLSLPDQTRLGKVNYKLAPTSPPRTFNTAFNAARPLYFTRRTQSSLSPPPFVVDLCVCSRKIKLSHYRATAVDRSLFWRQEV